VQGDVTKAAHIERLFLERERSLGRIDILVNNAGMYELAPLEEVTEEPLSQAFRSQRSGLLLGPKRLSSTSGPKVAASSTSARGELDANAELGRLLGVKAASRRSRACSRRASARGRFVGMRSAPGMIGTPKARVPAVSSAPNSEDGRGAGATRRMGRPDDIAPTGGVSGLVRCRSNMTGERCWCQAASGNRTVEAMERALMYRADNAL